MTSTLAGRADLLHALAADDPQLVAAMAELLGYRKEPERELLSPVLQTEAAELPTENTTQTIYVPANVPFWRIESFEAVAPVAIPQLAPALATLAADEQPAVAVHPSCLAPQAAVLTQLRRAVALRRDRHEVDVEAVVEHLGRGRLLDRLPYRQQRAWGENLYIVAQRTRRLVPYWHDQSDLVTSLRRVFPASGLRYELVEDDPPSILLGPGTVVLVLGDLGCLAERGERLRTLWGQWGQWGQELRAQGVTPVALVPVAPKDIPSELSRVWTILLWGAASGAVSSTNETVQRLLSLCSLTVRLEPGLLRAVRRLLPEGRSDPGLEARVWQDTAIASRSVVAALWHPQERLRLLARCAEEPEPLRRAVLELIRAWHRGLPPVWYSEIIDLDTQLRQAAISSAEWEAAVSYFSEIVARLAPSEGLSAADGAWIERSKDRFTPHIGDDPRVQRAIHRLFELIRSPDEETVPAWYDPAVLSSSEQPARQVELWQAADQLLVQWAGQPAVERGSRLGLLRSVNGELVCAPGRTATAGFVVNLRREPRQSIALPKGGTFRLHSDRDRLQFGLHAWPPWASEIGRDSYGLWAEFEFAGVRQRLRWIPPGRFWMGSPEDEEGRFRDEGPQHEVQITQGFWLFDTPCTQALWQAVMGKNPSQFKGKERPVEQVSWEDCQQFIARLNDHWPTLALALSSEAEWEYACRAGTTTARYADDLDAIAWYEENSGGETKPVKGRQPNGWGLYDMLGNVAEWCHDNQRDYAQPVGPDPLGPTTAGANRVFRGGLWRWGARRVRSAFRDADSPGLRYVLLGFRCASSSQASKMARREETDGGRARVRAGGR